MDIKKIINELEEKKADILFNICENEKIHSPEVIIHMVYELRAIIKILKHLKEEK